MIKHYRCPRCKKPSSGEGVIPTCKHDGNKIEMMEINLKEVNYES